VQEKIPERIQDLAHAADSGKTERVVYPALNGYH